MNGAVALHAVPLPVAAWSLASGWMLLWGLAAAIPIVIHLWSRRRQREVPWAAMDFLLRAIRQHARRLRLEQLILLATRSLILLLLALALADPWVSGLPAMLAAPGPRGQTHHVLVLDASYSMACRRGRDDYFEQAKQRATGYIKQSPQGDGFTLVLMADPPQLIIPQLVFDPADVLGEMEGLQLRHGGGDLAATLATVNELVKETGNRHPRIAQHRVCFFSDLGTASWDHAVTVSGRKQVEDLAKRATLLIDAIGETVAGNMAITRLAATDTLAAARQDTVFELDVQNYGSSSDRRRVEWLVDGQSVGMRDLELPAGGRSTTSFSQRFDTPGQHIVEARLGDDVLAVDNHRWLALSVPQAIRVLCVEGKPRAAEFIALALSPDRAGASLLEPEIASDGALLELDLEEYGCVFLCNLARLGRDEAGVLFDYAASGGGLITVLGDQVESDNYNAELGGDASARRVLPGRLGDVVGDRTYLFNPLEYQHPIVAPFRGHERSGLLTTPVWRYVQLEPAEEAKTALAFDNGDPAILTEQIGRGRSVLLATAASSASVDESVDPVTPWTALVSWPSFPPLIQEMVKYAMAGRTRQRNLLVGDPLSGAVPEAAGASTLTLTTPAGLPELIGLPASGDRMWSYSTTHTSGVYRLQQTESATTIGMFAVNIDPRESDLARLDAELLPRQFREWSADEADRDAEIGGEGSSNLFRLVLASVFVLACCESWLAWWFGRDVR